MRVKRYMIVSAAVLAAGAGAGGAIAATSGNDAKKTEQSVLDDAAKRLNVTPDALRSALGAAEDAQLDQAVKDGKITQAQADAIKAERAKDGRVLGGPGAGGGRGGHGPGDHGAPGPGGPAALDAAATALGLKAAELRTKLDAGKSIADVAKDQGKDIATVKSAIKDAVTKQLDADVTAGRLTAAQRTEELAELDQHLDDLVNRTPPKAGERGVWAAGHRGHRP
ncbi:MAG TPA: hypothetical protein VGO71_16165 [Baekduia sp.]|nr:hypothetical protein [Baekduia sp.]